MPRHLLLSLLIAGVCGACATPAVPLTDPAVSALSATQALDAAVLQHLGHSFNGVVLTRDGSNAAPLVRAYGMAREAPGHPARADTRYQIGSISKWISAVAILRLVDQHKLSLDTPIGSYLQDLPQHTGKSVTLRHLLTNTSGIPNGVMQAFRKDPSIAELPLSHLQASLRFGAGAPAFAPGSAWDYSPTNWVLVAAVIEHATGMDYATAVAQLVLAPAGAKATAVPRTPFRDMPGVAIAYRNKMPRELAMSPHVSFVAASGTLYSTAADLAALAHAVYETPLLSASARRELSRVAVEEQEYALGGRVRSLTLGGAVRKVAWESGATGGYKSLLAYVPGDSRTVVILNNTDLPQGDIGRAGEALLAALYAGSKRTMMRSGHAD